MVVLVQVDVRVLMSIVLCDANMSSNKIVRINVQSGLAQKNLNKNQQTVVERPISNRKRFTSGLIDSVVDTAPAARTVHAVTP